MKAKRVISYFRSYLIHVIRNIWWLIKGSYWLWIPLVMLYSYCLFKGYVDSSEKLLDSYIAIFRILGFLVLIFSIERRIKSIYGVSFKRLIVEWLDTRPKRNVVINAEGEVITVSDSDAYVSGGQAIKPGTSGDELIEEINRCFRDAHRARIKLWESLNKKIDQEKKKLEKKITALKDQSKEYREKVFKSQVGSITKELLGATLIIVSVLFPLADKYGWLCFW